LTSNDTTAVIESELLKNELLKIQYKENYTRHRHLDLLFWSTPFTTIGVVGITSIQVLNSDLILMWKGIIFILLGLVAFVFASQLTKFYGLMNQHAQFVNDIEKKYKLDLTPYRTQFEEFKGTNRIISFFKLECLMNKQFKHSSRMRVIVFMNYFWISVLLIGIVLFIIPVIENQ
jgi:hypothetical protein